MFFLHLEKIINTIKYHTSSGGTRRKMLYVWVNPGDDKGASQKNKKYIYNF